MSFERRSRNIYVVYYDVHACVGIYIRKRAT